MSNTKDLQASGNSGDTSEQSRKPSASSGPIPEQKSKTAVDAGAIAHESTDKSSGKPPVVGQPVK
jgi:hypothetical protein